MLKFLLGIVLATSSISAYGAGKAEVVSQLPPRPDPSSISCHTDTWRDETLATVEDGFKLNKKLAPFVTQALADARAAGKNLQINSSYRSCAEQQSLRIAACGSGDYNQYVKPIDLCLPPTEPAGQSMHNEGLAVDFKCGGYGQFESSPCYTWLKANGYKYHLYEHRLEAWHWSTTSH